MSYCRWSSMEFDCDLYVYESESGFEIHAARRRPIIDRSTLPPAADILVDPDAYFARHHALMDLLDAEHDCEEIALPFAGASFCLDSAAECADKIEELIGLGYHVPDGVVEDLRSEANA